MANQPPHLLPPEDADWDAIARYFAGESSPDEAAAVRRWLEAHPSEASALNALSGATAQLSSSAPPDLDVEAALSRVIERRDAADIIPIDSRRSARTSVREVAPVRRWQPFAIAAAAAAVLVIAYGVSRRNSIEQPGYTVSPTSQTFATTVGQRDSVRLVDGTRIVLAPDSRLNVAAGYGGSVREVSLQGEAYFDVTHDEARPFVVHAGDAAIRDLGTTFTVRATGDQGVRVAVTSGSVSLARAQVTPNDSVVLRPGDAGTLGVDGRTLVERNGAAEADTAWTVGRLVFTNAPISTIRTEVRRWYGIDMQFDSSFAGSHLSTTFTGNESADDVLRVIRLSLGAEVTRQGNTATIKPAAARSR
jgi:transmembrane sensor